MIDYALVLKQAEEELEGMDERRQALLAMIAALKRLVRDAEPQPQPQPELALNIAPVARADVARQSPPAIPPGFFANKTPTQAYRELMNLWPGEYSPPQIASIFEAGGMASKTRTSLVQAVHSVLKRERQRQKKEPAAA